MKQQVAIHGRDHRLGGADPLRPDLPFIWGGNGALTQSVTAHAELTFATVKTNDRGSFRWDEANDPEGLLVYRPGIYLIALKVAVDSGDNGVARSVYPTAQLLSNGPLFGVGSEFGGFFDVGLGQSQASLAAVTSTNTISKSNLNYWAIGEIQPDTVTPDPIRVAAILSHDGADFDTSSTVNSSTLYVARLSGRGDDAPPPTDLTP